MADDLVSAKQKLLVGDADNNIPPFNFDSLPMSVIDPVWNRIETSYNLSLAELSVLKNARCQAGLSRELITTQDLLSNWLLLQSWFGWLLKPSTRKKGYKNLHSE
mmetsp:Transcript_28555/g.36928  ORF Transcript_28555/g.36928 Transcript_28555/m.36928 type:complete len:105 (-) Transcript_28555:4737-5051(-)